MRNGTWMRKFLLKCLFGMTALLGAFASQGGPYDGWVFHAPVTFSGYDRAEALTNFPALVVVSNACFGGAYAFSYSQLQSGSNDLAFTDADGNSLNYEIDTWNPDGVSAVWVQVPVLTNNATVTAWWGAAGQAAQACTTNGAAWTSAYVGVWHHRNGSGGSDPDSTTNACAFTVANGPTQTVGVVGGALSFNGTSQYLTRGATPALNFGTGDFSVEGWFNPYNNDLWYSPLFVGGNNWHQGAGGLYYFKSPASTISVAWNQLWPNPFLAAEVSQNQWHYACLVRSSSTLSLYVDGVLRTSGNVGTTALGFNQDDITDIAGNTWDGANGYFPGGIDEQRAAGEARSSNWVWAVYQNMASNAVFQSYGTAAASRATPAIRNVAATNVTQTSACPNGLLATDGSSAATVTLYWGPADGGSDAAAWGHALSFGANARPTPADYTTGLTGLASGATYYFRYYAVNDSGSAWASPTLSFTTLAVPAVSNAGGATGVYSSGAVLNGTVAAGTPAPSVYVCWGTADGGTATDAWQNVVAVGVQAGTFSKVISGLMPGTVYAYRCYAVNSQGEAWSPAPATFTTSVWTLNGSTLTDGNWSLTVGASGDGYTVTGCSAGSGDLDLRHTGFSITRIGGAAFYQNQQLTSLELPDTVTAIDDSAFRQTLNLTRVVLSSSLQTIGPYAFCWDSGLTTVTPFLPDSVTRIDYAAFGSCTALSSPLRICNPAQAVTLAQYAFDYSAIPSVDLSSVTDIGGFVFQENHSLTNVVFSSELRTIGERAFCKNTGLTQLTFPASLQAIGPYAFCWDSGLTTVTPFLPDSVKDVGTSAFGACTALSSPLRICNPTQFLILSQYAFDYCAIPSADLSSVTNIGVYAFREVTRLTNVVFSAALETIGEYAFVRDSGLTQLTLPASLKTIGTYAFCWNSGLTTVTPFLPDTVTEIGMAAFGSCTSLTSPLRICNPAQAPTLGQYAFDYSKIPSADLSSVTNISGYAFREGRSLTNVVFSAGLMSIGTEAFCNCTGLRSVYFCGSPATLGSSVFLGPANYQMRTYIPKGHAEWQPIAASQVTALTADETTAFQAAYPGEKLPLGTWAPSGAGLAWFCSWVAPQDQHNGTVMVLK